MNTTNQGMLGWKKIFCVLSIIGVSVLVVERWLQFSIKDKPAESARVPTSSFSTQSIIPIAFNATFFFNALRQFPPDAAPASVCAGAKAVIVPHHDIASSLIAEIFSEVGKNFDPTTIIVIGPNHPNAGSAMVHSAELSWKTPDGGMVSANEDMITQLARSGLVNLNADIVRKEHSVYVPIAFIRNYFPKAQVVPIIINSNQKTENSFVLAKVLSNIVDKNTLIIGSIDFSHYLPSSATVSKDALTQELLIEKNYEKIASLNNDYIDSPQTLITVLKTAELLGASNVHVVNHSELGKIAGHPVQSSTSYFTLCIE